MFCNISHIQKRLRHGPKPCRDRSALKKNNDPNCSISWYSQRSFPTPFVFLSRPQRWLSCNPCYNNFFRGPFAVKAETLQSHGHMRKIEPGLGMHWQCFCPPFSWHVQLKIRKRNCGTLVTMRNSCLQLRRDLNPLPLHILKAGMHTTPDWNHCYNMFLLKRTAEVPGAKDMVSEAWTLASH